MGMVQYDGVQPLADGGAVRELLDGAVPADRRKGTAHGRVLLQEEGRIVAPVHAIPA